MKTLELSQLETLEGGGSGSFERAVGCAGFAIGVFGLAFAIAAVPATGGVSLATYASIYAGAVGTGISMASCFPG